MNTPLIIGANYHTTWQSHRAMRFKLAEIGNNEYVKLKTKSNPDGFWVDKNV